MPDIRVSAEVLRLIGEGTLQRLGSAAFSSYNCVNCGKSADTDQPTRVVVRRYRGGEVRAKLAHAGCVDLEIVEIDDDPPDRGPAGMGALTVALGYPDEPAMRPLLLLEPLAEKIRVTQTEDTVTVSVAALQGYGLALMASGSQLPEEVEDWRLHRPDPDSARLVVAGNSVVYGGPCDQPDGWAELVDSVGACVVLFGTIGLFAARDGRFTQARIRRMLDEAAHAGLLVGGIVLCAGSYVAGLSPAERRPELDRRIAQYWRRPD